VVVDAFDARELRAAAAFEASLNRRLF